MSVGTEAINKKESANREYITLFEQLVNGIRAVAIIDKRTDYKESYNIIER